jgi:hypothetical protein
MDLLKRVLDAMALLLSNAPAMSVLFGLIVSVAGTQYLKFRIPVPAPLQDEYRWFVRMLSLPLGFVPVFCTWPSPNRAWVALCVGLGAPTIYKVAVAILYWKWPALEARLSARPAPGELE